MLRMETKNGSGTKLYPTFWQARNKFWRLWKARKDTSFYSFQRYLLYGREVSVIKKKNWHLNLNLFNEIEYVSVTLREATKLPLAEVISPIAAN